MSLLVSGAFAFEYPSTITTADDVLNSLRGFTTASQLARITQSREAISSVIVSDSSNLYFAISLQSSNPVRDLCKWVAVSSGTLIYYNNYFYVSDSAAVVKYYQFQPGGESGSFDSKTVASGTTHTVGDVVYYRVQDINNFARNFFSSDATVYASSPFYVSDVLYTPRNMTLGTFSPDTRVFEVWKSVDYPESSNPLEYINVRLDGYVDLNLITSQKIRFDYIDQDGNSLYKVFSESDFHDIQYDSDDDLYTFYIFPYLISSYEFTITSATYYADNEWAEKTIELYLTYNEDVIYPLPAGWNDSYYITQYFNSNSNGRLSYGSSNIFYKVDGIYTYWTDEYLVCWQNFDVKGLFVPDFLTSDFNNNLDLQEVYSLFEQYDVVFTDCIEAEIDGICGQHVYDNTHDVFQLQGFIPALRFLISYGVIQQHRSLPLSVDSGGLSYFDNVGNGFIVTRSFLIKRALAALGDLDDRLLEFEENLVGEDSLGSSLQNKLDNLLSQQNTFFSDVSRFFQKLEYGLNGASLSNVEKWLKDIRDSLVGEFHFDFEVLEHPWLDIYEFVKALFDDGVAFLGDFSVSADAMLNGSSMTSLPISTITVTPALPFNPTPIPIPTIQGGG